MCILLKLHYARFNVSSVFCSKVIEEKSLGGRLDPPPLLKEGLRGSGYMTTPVSDPPLFNPDVITLFENLNAGR